MNSNYFYIFYQLKGFHGRFDDICHRCHRKIYVVVVVVPSKRDIKNKIKNNINILIIQEISFLKYDISKKQK